MPGSQLALRTSREGSTLRLLVSGDFDRAGAGWLERALEEALEAPTKRVVLDLGAVTSLDLGAIKTLLKTHTRARSSGSS
jgi:anti-anti-sigma regulatory factor